MAERDIRGMISADAAAVRDKIGMGVPRCRKRDHLLDNIGLVLTVPVYAPVRRAMLTVQALGIDAVDAEQLKRSAVDAFADGLHEPPVLVIIETPTACWEDQHPRSAMAEDE
jgi:hypothetical protein